MCDNLIFPLMEFFCVQELHVKFLLREWFIIVLCTYLCCTYMKYIFIANKTYYFFCVVYKKVLHLLSRCKHLSISWPYWFTNMLQSAFRPFVPAICCRLPWSRPCVTWPASWQPASSWVIGKDYPFPESKQFISTGWAAKVTPTLRIYKAIFYLKKLRRATLAAHPVALNITKHY